MDEPTTKGDAMTGRVWRRLNTAQGTAYSTLDARIHDNGAGMGPSRGSGRWALEVRGVWVANVDTLAAAKMRAEELLDDARRKGTQ